ncbi:GH92 family glycosyl hydrolase [Chitinophaga sancti]|uniref:GH92 family glycosyl hydrolase n=1 Tax=Chitinophaga sancti TaxID=1004 RepID=UPI002A74D387|nr:GH92 family glycosyl hydrolase [Chitinophaga sancti]WPQ62746.1 GH92 family glycosyl hydrolase [Chitinophaga sancti]
MRLIVSMAAIACLFHGSVSAQTSDLLRYVQPLSGTAASTTASSQKHGSGTESYANTIPAVGLPFGMTQWTPQTNTTENKCFPPYTYRDSLLTGFRGTHWLSGSCTQDYGSFTIMPITGHFTTNYATPFSHDKEISTPAYYKLTLPAVSTEITATLRCSMFQFTMEKTDSLYLLLTPNSDRQEGIVKINAYRHEITGYNPVHRIYQGWGEPAGFCGYFVMQIETVTPLDKSGYAAYYLQKGEQVRVRIGTSFTSIDNARKNLEAEIPDWDFAALKAKNEAVWNKALSQIQVETTREKDKRIFYTALYHAMQHPRLFNDVDGKYPRFAGDYQNERVSKGDYYDDYSMWDIYRAQLPLFEILQPKLVNDFVNSLVLKGQQGGWLPIFPCWNSYTAAMIGDHATAFIASAFNKGIRDYDVNAAYELMRKNAFEMSKGDDYLNGKGRRALDSYIKYGYIPMEDSVPIAFHKKEQVSRTLEYAYDDYALSTVAKALGKTADYEILAKRAQNYNNVIDPKVGMARGKYADGSWYSPFNADKKEPYITEGTPRQYTFYVPQDVTGLAKKINLKASLDSLFGKDEYWHGNEPGHQIPFMYNFTAAPEKTSKTVHKILAEEYADGPGGLSGNDDAGQMSAWYLFASMGFYPVDPVSNNYELSVPIFDKVTILLPDNKKFQLKAVQRRGRRSLLYNGKELKGHAITYEQIMQGGELVFFF